MNCHYLRLGFKSVSIFFCFAATIATAQTTKPRQFPPGAINRLEDIPQSRLRTRVEHLPAAARSRALEVLRNFHFTESDLISLEVDPEGGIFYVDDSPVLEAAEPVLGDPITAEASVPANPLPATLSFHSKPGSPNVIYLNFVGENVSGTAWNSSLARTEIPVVAFSSDNDYATFSDSEQIAIKRIWQRVSEDYAPFDVDVTTERPASFGSRTAHALITRNTDANGNANPSSGAGGVAYVNVFGSSNYGNYRHAWIYFNNLSSVESWVAEAVSHEVGHNLGLSHDGQTDGSAYYGGHGSGFTSWGPIMGTGYNRHVSQWSKGEYYLANNTQDDLATIASKISYRTDDCGDTISAAKALSFSTTNIISTTPENDPANTNSANKGVLERNTDVDVFSFTTGSGSINLSVKPWIVSAGMRGGNLDLLLELRDANGSLLMTNNPADETIAQIQTTLTQGAYYLFIRNVSVGSPLSSNPSGYTSYACIGQYFINGSVTPANASASSVQIVATVNNPAFGSVSLTDASFSVGSTIQILATPAKYYQFVGWANGASGPSNPLTLVLTTNISVQAVFAEQLTANFPTPFWWLASYGYTNFESAVVTVGANGIPLWQSYIAGLNPNDLTSQLRVSLTGNVLTWNPLAGRVYTILESTNFNSGFNALSDATDLPATTWNFTFPTVASQKMKFYKLGVRKL